MEFDHVGDGVASAALLPVPGRPFLCDHPQCGRSFVKRSKLNRHAATHLAIGAYRCTACERTFHRSEHLRRHTATHDAVIKSFNCTMSDCHAAFATRSHLLRHLRAHNKVYACAECAETFDKHHKLRAHRRAVHDGTMPHTCTVCDRSFESRSLLTKHHRLTHAPDRFVCGYDQCGQTFARFLLMKKHIDETHKEATKKDATRFACVSCNKDYSSHSALSQHRRAHHADVPNVHACALCQRTFTHKHTLQRHEYMFHTDAGRREREERREQSALERVRRALCGKRTADDSNETFSLFEQQQQTPQEKSLSPQQQKRRRLDVTAHSDNDSGDESSVISSHIASHSPFACRADTLVSSNVSAHLTM